MQEVADGMTTVYSYNANGNLTSKMASTSMVRYMKNNQFVSIEGDVTVLG